MVVGGGFEGADLSELVRQHMSGCHMGVCVVPEQFQSHLCVCNKESARARERARASVCVCVGRRDVDIRPLCNLCRMCSLT